MEWFSSFPTRKTLTTLEQLRSNTTLQCTDHAAYLVAIAVGLLTFVNALLHLWPIPILTLVILLGLISSILLSSTIHILGRTFYWSYLASTVLRVAPKKESEIKLEEGATATSLLLLHQACTNHVRRNHRIIGTFHTGRLWGIELWFIFFISFSLIWLLLNL